MTKLVFLLLVLTIPSTLLAESCVELSQKFVKSTKESAHLNSAHLRRSQKLLTDIYGKKKGKDAYGRVLKLVRQFKAKKIKFPSNVANEFSENDIFLITYGDSIVASQGQHLKTLHEFYNAHLSETFTDVHILPFFPYSSDHGFSVKDFLKVREDLGDWDDVKGFSKDARIMYDYVLNHVSSESDWVKKYLKGEKGFENLLIEVKNPEELKSELSMVTRPRTSPLLHEFEKANGEKVNLWTTFSKDQLDLNFEDLDTFERMLSVLLEYVEQGASTVRLDAVTYLWKKLGTNSVHRPETHNMVKLFKSVLNEVAPHVKIISETNVPHLDNISYFGKLGDEADMVYNFALPPLSIHMFNFGDASHFSRWAKELETEHSANHFFNFSSSHDGIGLNGARGILPDKDIQKMEEIVKENGGLFGLKNNPDGSTTTYEMNTTLFDAFVKDGFEEKRIQATFATQMSLPGVPAFYVNTIFGDTNWVEGVSKSGINRSINRRQLGAKELTEQLSDSNSVQSRTFEGLKQLAAARKKSRAFHPESPFEVMDFGKEIFAIKRGSGEETVYCLTNATSNELTVDLSKLENVSGQLKDLITSTLYQDKTQITLRPYETLWLREITP